MKRLLILLVLACSVQLNAQDLIYECGQNSGTNFNGWFTQPYTAFDAVEYDAQSVSFLAEYGGYYSVTLTKQLKELNAYDNFSLLFNFTALNNSTISSVTYYTSEDGRKWTPLNNSKNNTAVTVKNTEGKIQYVRAVAESQFYDNGIIACNYFKAEEIIVEDTTALTLLPENIDFPEDTFLIFNLAHSINIETAVDLPYEVTVFSLTGQIVYTNIHQGSERIELQQSMSGIYVITVTQQNILHASKKIAL